MKRWITSLGKTASRLLLVTLVLAGAWYGFLKLVNKPPIETSAALIMVWASVFLLILTAFPQILNRIKSLKIKDFEVELQDTIAQAGKTDYLSLADLKDQYIFGEKEGWETMFRIADEAARQPGKPILLVANLKDANYIAVAMLYAYLFLLDLVCSSVAVLFISARESPQNLNELRKDTIVGMISGKKVLLDFNTRFPELVTLLRAVNADSPSLRTGLRGVVSEGALFDWYGYTRTIFDQSSHPIHLSSQMIQSWFRGSLSTVTIDISLAAEDISALQEAIARSDEFVLLYRGDRFETAAPACSMTRDIARKALKN